MFSRESCEIFKNTSFVKHLRATAFDDAGFEDGFKRFTEREPDLKQKIRVLFWRKQLRKTELQILLQEFLVLIIQLGYQNLVKKM